MALSASQQALLQLGAGFLANPTGNFARNAGMAIGPALETYRAGRTQEQTQQQIDAKAASEARARQIEGVKYMLDQVRRQALANAGTDPAGLQALAAQRDALNARLAGIMGVGGMGMPAGAPAARGGPDSGGSGGSGAVATPVQAPKITMTPVDGQRPPVQNVTPSVTRSGPGMRELFPDLAMDIAKIKPTDLGSGVTQHPFTGETTVVPPNAQTMVVPDGKGGWKAIPNPAYIAANRQMEADKGRIGRDNTMITITTDQGSQIQTTFGQAGGTRGGVQITPIRSVEGENEGLRIAGQDFYGKFVPNLLRENKGLQGQISTLQAMRDMLDTGISSGGAELRPYLQGFRDVLAFVTGNEQLTTATSVEGLFAQLATSGALDILASQPGVKTDFEFRVAQSVMPNLTDSAEQNKFRIAFMQAQAQRLVTFNQRVVNLAMRNKDPNDRLFNTMDSTEIMNTAAASMESLLEMPELRAYQDYMRSASKRLGGTL